MAEFTHWWDLGRLCLPKIFFLARYGGFAAVASEKARFLEGLRFSKPPYWEQLCEFC
jgi:hypothetical protein